MKSPIDVCGTEIYNNDATQETYISLRGAKLTPEVVFDLLLIRYELMKWATSKDRDMTALADALLAAKVREVINGPDHD